MDDRKPRAGGSRAVVLNPRQGHTSADEIERRLSARVVGQDGAVKALAQVYQAFRAGIHPRNRPVGTVLLLGPTGSGKTHVVQAMASVLFDEPSAVLKIDCAEYQHPHELAKLIGSPPGYAGHRETRPLLSQDNIDRHRTAEHPLSLVLFDEVEKACDGLLHLLLGMLDTGRLTLGDNSSVDLRQTIIVLTSNLGAREMSRIVSPGVGFADASRMSAPDDDALGDRLARAALAAASHRLPPELMNRIDHTVVFRPLAEDELRQVLDLELREVQSRIRETSGGGFVVECSEEARAVLLREGTDAKYGARHLKRAIERLLVHPLSMLMASDQVEPGDVILVDAAESDDAELIFTKDPEAAVTPDEGPGAVAAARAGAAAGLPPASADTGREAAMAQLTASLQRAGLI